MKFVHVSIFAFSSLCGADEPTRLSGRSPYENDPEAYLDTVFPGKFTKEGKDRVLDLIARGGYIADDADFRDGDDIGGPCHRPGFLPSRSLSGVIERKADRDGSLEKKIAKVGDYLTNTVEQNVKGWCCSKQMTQNMAATGSRDRQKGVCDCKHKGEKTGINGGLVCCSQYAVEKDGEMVCGGIPPTGVMQPLQVDKYEAAFMINLSVSDCMFPESGTEKEVSARVSQFIGARRALIKAGDMLACAKRKCQDPGKKPTDEKPICCGGTEQDYDWKRSADPRDKVCGCAHAGQRLSPYTTAGAEACCSGVMDGKRVCTCISDHLERPPHADTKDCCTRNVTERNKKFWCKTDTCTEQGLYIKKMGSHCCANKTTGITYPVGQPCGCVPGGMAEVDGNAARCCSKRLNANKTCAWIGPEEPVEPHVNETDCFSGKMNELRLCVCMAPFSTLRRKEYVKEHSEHCCSKYMIEDAKSSHRGTCGCIRTGDPLGYGSDATHCCSGKAEDGKCACVEAGGRFSADEGMKRSDCCSNRASDQFCLCKPFNQSGAAGCCTETQGMNEAVTCPCLPDGYRVPASERADASAVCCTKPSSSKCSSTCGQ